MGPLPSWIKTAGSTLGSQKLTQGLRTGEGLTSLVYGMMGTGGGAEMPNPYDVNPFEPAIEAQQYSTEQEAAAQEKQAEIAMQEAVAQARQKAQSVRDFRENQALGYSGAGVLLEGSPMLVLEETRKRGQQEVNAILNRGAALSDLLRRKAMITRNQGRAAILGQRAQYEFGKSQFDLNQELNNSTPFNGVNEIATAIETLGSMFGGGGKTPGAPMTPKEEPLPDIPLLKPQKNAPLPRPIPRPGGFQLPFTGQLPPPMVP